MKKLLIIFMSIFILLLAIIAIMNYERKRDDFKWNQNILQNVSNSDLAFPICLRWQHLYQISTSLNHDIFDYDLTKLPVNFLLNGIAEIDLSPMVYNNDIFYLCQRDHIQIYSISQNEILWEGNFTKIIGTTLPTYRNGILSFYILERDGALNSYIVSKMTYIDNKMKGYHKSTVNKHPKIK